MTWTYDVTMLDEPLHAVRLRLGDTDINDQLLQDEEIQTFIDEQSNIYMAAAEAAEAIVAKYQSAVSSKSSDGKNISYERITNYMELAKKLRVKATRHAAGKPYAGGTSKADKEKVEKDSDRDAPAFELGMHDQEGTETSPLRSGPIP